MAWIFKCWLAGAIFIAFLAGAFGTPPNATNRTQSTLAIVQADKATKTAALWPLWGAYIVGNTIFGRQPK